MRAGAGWWRIDGAGVLVAFGHCVMMWMMVVGKRGWRGYVSWVEAVGMGGGWGGVAGGWGRQVKGAGYSSALASD